MVNDLYYIDVDGERVSWDDYPDAQPWYDALHVTQGAFDDGAKEVTLTIKERRDE